MDYEVKADPLEAAFEAAVIPAAVMRPQLAAGDAVDPARSAFVEGYLRKGREVELKSFAGNVPADGGYAVPREIDAVIDATLKSISPIRAVANVVQVGSAGYRKLVTTNGVASGWASEVAARPTTATPTFNEIVPSFGELYANPAATQAMLDDAQFDVEAWLADEIATQFAKAEGTAFVNGDGIDKPKGFLTYTIAATGDATRSFGQLQYVPVGAASDFPATNPQDKLLDLVHALRAPYRQGAVWVMNSAMNAPGMDRMARMACARLPSPSTTAWPVLRSVATARKGMGSLSKSRVSAVCASLLSSSSDRFWPWITPSGRPRLPSSRKLSFCLTRKSRSSCLRLLGIMPVPTQSMPCCCASAGASSCGSRR